MAIQIKHQFVSLKGDGTDATQVQPSNWNATHSITLASGQLIGRLTAGAGAAEEIPISAYMAALLASADNAALAGAIGIFETGDVKFTFRTTASAGWIKLVGGAGPRVSTIGNPGSNALLRANNDTLALFTIIWDACDNTLAPTYDSAGNPVARGANAAADFAANKSIVVPNPVGKVIVGAGLAVTGMPVTSSLRALGSLFGEEVHTLTAAEIAAHFHAVFLNDPGHTHSISGNANFVASTVFNAAYDDVQARAPFLAKGSHISTDTTNITVRDTAGGGGTADRTATNSGGGGAHNNMQPGLALNPMVKL